MQKLKTTLMIVGLLAIASCSGSDGTPTGNNNSNPSTNISTQNQSSSNPNLPTVEQVATGTRGRTSFQVNVSNDRDFSPERVGSGSDNVLEYAFADGNYLYPILRDSYYSIPSPNKSIAGQFSVHSGTGDSHLYYNIFFDFIEPDLPHGSMSIRAIGFSSIAPEWFAIFFDTPAVPPSSNVSQYDGGFLEGVHPSNTAAERAKGLAKITIDYDALSVVVSLDDERNQVLKSNELALQGVNFSGEIRNDDGTIRGTISGALSGERSGGVGGTYAWVGPNDTRAAGVFAATNPALAGVQ